MFSAVSASISITFVLSSKMYVRVSAKYSLTGFLTSLSVFLLAQITLVLCLFSRSHRAHDITITQTPADLQFSHINMASAPVHYTFQNTRSCYLFNLGCWIFFCFSFRFIFHTAAIDNLPKSHQSNPNLIQK